MGSGLILLVLVGAWLAVLVPMGLRAHDGTPSRSAERFGDAVRVLRRRGAAVDEPDAAPPPVPGPEPAAEPVGARGSRLLDTSGRVGGALRSGAGRATTPVRRVLHGSVRVATRVQVAVRPPSGPVRGGSRRVANAPGRTAAARRRRVLLVLLLLTVAAVVAGLVASRALLAVAVLLGAVTVLYAVRCRRAAARAQQRRRARARAARLERLAVADRTVAVRVRPAPAEPVPAELVVELAPAEPAAASRVRRPAAGGEWDPVPVPLPMYVGKAVAPRPAPAPLRAPRRAPDIASLDDPGALGDGAPAPAPPGHRAVGDW